MFILGTIFGSFYNVVGFRLPQGESLIRPASHCPKCNHRLKPLELIPILSYLFQRGRCKNCRTKISSFYPIFECLTGILFALAYISFGFSYELIIALTFISLIIIITVSDINFYIISDEVLIFFGILLFIEIFLINGINVALISLLNGLGAFITMFLLKMLGDFLFKKESMGGGDIKLMFIFGMVLSYPMTILSIFLGSLIGLFVTIILNKKKGDIIQFGPLLSMGALIVLLTRIDLDNVINFYRYIFHRGG